VVVRDDLPRGFLAAQVVHAAGESSPGDLPHGTYAIVLAAASEAHLRHLAVELEQAGVPHTLITEPDAPWNGAATAIGLQPTQDRKLIASILGRLPTLK
jgi:peptidyl-tRNA hydrolase